MAQSSDEKMRAWTGPALFSYGFRPFFLFGAIWAAFAMVLWILMLAGALHLPTRLDPISWHAHAFLFGYLGAVMAGFLLTAVPNWTGRLPLVGWPLAALFALWGAGRVAVLSSALLPPAVTALVDLAFPVVLGAVILREIIAGKNWHNLVVLGLLVMFTVSNGIFHFEAGRGDYAAQGVGLRLGLATAILMISVIGGRIVPSFTRNWLARGGSGVRPAPPMRPYDKAVLLASIPILLFWVAYPFTAVTAVCLLALGVLHLIRLFRWQGHHTIAEPLVWVLHVSYSFIPLGAFTLGATILMEGTSSLAAQHLWMAGAIGAMTVAVMTRATLGHCGLELAASRATCALYLSIFVSVAARLGAEIFPWLIHVSGVFWIAAFGGFVLAYGRLLISRRVNG